jgi:hypothetical protein
MRHQRRATNSDFIEQTRDIDYLRDRLAESFAELEMLREEAAHYCAIATDLERRLKIDGRRPGRDAA